MDAAIIWLVVWVVLAFAGAWLIVALLGLGGVGIAAATDWVWLAPVMMFLGYALAVVWFIFAAVQVVLQVVSVVQYATA